MIRNVTGACREQQLAGRQERHAVGVFEIPRDDGDADVLLFSGFIRERTFAERLVRKTCRRNGHAIGERNGLLSLTWRAGGECRNERNGS